MPAAAFLAAVPDTDATVDLRGILLSGRCSLAGEPDTGFVACSRSYPVAVAWGTPADVSVDTLAPHRRRGLAGACFALLAREMERRGKRPVWGALDDNTASLSLAARLGFEPAARLTSFVRP